MPVKLFILNNVPDDEAEEVRELLRHNAIDFYETPAGFWGIFVAAIWLSDENQLQQARQLINQYQSERLAKAKEEYAQQQREGRRRTIVNLIQENPLRFLAYLAAIAAVIYFSTKPFIDFGK